MTMMRSLVLVPVTLLSLGDLAQGDDVEATGFCYTKYVHVSVVKQVPSYSKHCTKVMFCVFRRFLHCSGSHISQSLSPAMKVDDVKCKTTYKNSFTTKMETQCTPTFDTSCNTVLQTAYKQVEHAFGDLWV